MTRFIALLRAVNLGGRKVEMARLRKVAERLGASDVATYIASGNLVFSLHGSPSNVRAQLEAAIAKEFGIEVPVILRTLTQWERYEPACPFADAAASAPNKLYLLLSQAKPKADAVRLLRERAVGGEHVERIGDALWIHYPAGMARTKLAPGFVDKCVGSATTARNWNTVVALGELARGKT